MELNGIRLMVKDFDSCFRFYSEQLGLNVSWGKIGGDYASFDIGMPSGLSIFKSDLMASAVGTLDLPTPENCRDKMAIVIKVDNVDSYYEKFSMRGIKFINKPTEMTGWGMKTVHLRDPEGNLIELWSELSWDKWDKGLQEEAKEYETK